jgi:hypothetical protein
MDRWGHALDTFIAVRERRKAQEEAEIARAMNYMAENPALAETMGQDLIKKYGRKQPHLVSLVETLRHQNELNAQAEAALNRHARGYSKEVGERRAFADTVESMPDSMPQPFSMFGGSVEVPNMAKQAARSQMATMAPPEWSAWEKLSDEERYAATIAMQRAGIKVPEAPETIGPKDLSQAARDLIAAGYQITSPEVRTTVRAGAGLEEKPAEIAKRGIEAKAESEKNARELAEEAAKDERELGQQITVEQRRAGIERGMVDYRQSVKPAKGSPEDKDQKKADATVILTELDRRDPRNEDALNERGEEMPENPLMLRERKVILDLSMKAVDKGVDPAEAVRNLLAAYDELIHSGKKPQEALDALRAIAK